jgi:SAM-dependent methyltransferase
MALRPGAGRVVGVEIGSDIDKCAPLAREHLGLTKLPTNLSLHRVIPGTLHDPNDRFDLIYSWSVFEHIQQDLLPATVQMLRKALLPGGLLFTQIAPLYYSSEGSHFFPEIPERWGHLIHQDNIYRDKIIRATKAAPWSLSTYETLNRITAPGLVKLIVDGGFEILRQYRTREEYEIPPTLLDAYQEDALRTNQVVLLARPKD